MTAYDDHYARWSYEQLILQQPHIQFQGLWRVGYHHYIVCNDAESAQTTDGENLCLWFDHKCRVATASVHIVTSHPPNAERVPERSSSDRALLVGAPRNRREVLVDLCLALPHEFPSFAIRNPGADVVMVTSRKLTSKEKALAQSSFASLGYFTPLKFSVDLTKDPETEEFRFWLGQGDIELIPSRRLAGKASQELRKLVENDEQFWADNRNKILTTFHTESNALLPTDWDTKQQLGCLVDASVFAPENIRTYLSLYDTVYLVLPIKECFESNCLALGVTPAELEKLAGLGRIRVILPQSVDRYPGQWLNAVAESAPQSLLFSRRLAATTICDARHRLPLLYPPLSPAERYGLLHAIATHAAELVGSAKRDRLLRFIAGLGDKWSRIEWSVQDRGAMGTSHLGIGAIAGAVYEQVAGRDLRLEIWSAAQKVEWAAALGAHVFPPSSGEYNEVATCDLVAGVYGPITGKPTTVVPPSTLSAITKLLAIDNRVSVVEFTKEFSSSDIKRLRQLVLRLTRENVDPACLADAIKKFNAEVRHYERRPDLLKSLNLVGLISAGAVAAGKVDPSIQRMVPLAGMLIGFAVNRFIDEVPRYSGIAGGVIDFLNSALTGKTNAGAVLVARARKDVALLSR